MDAFNCVLYSTASTYQSPVEVCIARLIHRSHLSVTFHITLSRHQKHKDGIRCISDGADQRH
jgi:hypothetical protein